VIAASRGQSNVLDYFLQLPSIDLFARNLQNETAYDIVAQKQDLLSCQKIEHRECVVWSLQYPDGSILRE
jgi:hypothetical protein